MYQGNRVRRNCKGKAWGQGDELTGKGIYCHTGGPEVRAWDPQDGRG